MTRHLASLLGRFLVSGLVILTLAAVPAAGQEEKERSDAEGQSKADAKSSKSETAETSEKTGKTDPSPREATAKRVDSKQSRNISPLVQAAQSTGATPAKRSFTDADLKNAKGRLIVVEGSNVREPQVPSIEERAPELFRQGNPEKAAETVRQYTRQQQIERLREQIRALSDELGDLENEYLVTEEDDYRESVNQRFVQKQKELAAAQKRLKELQGGGN